MATVGRVMLKDGRKARIQDTRYWMVAGWPLRVGDEARIMIRDFRTIQRDRHVILLEAVGGSTWLVETYRI